MSDVGRLCLSTVEYESHRGGCVWEGERVERGGESGGGGGVR